MPFSSTFKNGQIIFSLANHYKKRPNGNHETCPISVAIKTEDNKMKILFQKTFFKYFSFFLKQEINPDD